MKCPDCGSNRIQKEKCEHCGGTAVQDNCKMCLSPIPLRAKFCPGCGTPSELTLNPGGGGPDCPDCHRPTLREMHGNVAAYRCHGCQGIWIPKEEWEKLKQQAAQAPQGTPPPEKPACDQPYRKCPVCGGMLNRKTPGPRMPTLDICWKDGVWLDAGELQPAIEAMRHNATQQPTANPSENLTPDLLRMRLLGQKRQEQHQSPEETEPRSLLESILGNLFFFPF